MHEALLARVGALIPLTSPTVIFIAFIETYSFAIQT
jgi:hypothetical protein